MLYYSIKSIKFNVIFICDSILLNPKDISCYYIGIDSQSNKVKTWRPHLDLPSFGEMALSRVHCTNFQDT